MKVFGYPDVKLLEVIVDGRVWVVTQDRTLDCCEVELVWDGTEWIVLDIPEVTNDGFGCN